MLPVKTHQGPSQGTVLRLRPYLMICRHPRFQPKNGEGCQACQLFYLLATFDPGARANGLEGSERQLQIHGGLTV